MTLSPRVARLRAPNKSAMTLDGTNGYIIDGGDGAWIAIDPGPDIATHVTAFVDAARERGARYEAILVTHGHPDHYPAAAPLARATGAPVYAHPAAPFRTTARSPTSNASAPARRRSSRSKRRATRPITSCTCLKTNARCSPAT